MGLKARMPRAKCIAAGSLDEARAIAGELCNAIRALGRKVYEGGVEVKFGYDFGARATGKPQTEWFFRVPASLARS